MSNDSKTVSKKKSKDTNKYPVDTLKEFGENFQNKAIAVLLNDEQFTRSIIDIFKPEFFDSSKNIYISKIIKQYFENYNTTPTVDSLKVLAKKGSLPDGPKKRVLEQLDIIYGLLESPDLQFTKEEFRMFCKNQEMKNAILESTDFLSAGEYDLIYSRMNKALQAGNEEKLGHDFIEDVESRLNQPSRKTIPTGLNPIDCLLQGGLGPGELGTFLAPSGAGKSWALAFIGNTALQLGLGVVHYTLELNETYTSHRYDTILTGIPSVDLKLRHNKSKVKDRIEEVKKKGGKLIVRQFPTKGATAFTLYNHTQRLRNLGFKIDIMIVDYADLLRDANGNSTNSYESAGSIYEELRGIGGKLDLPIWTVSQTQRQAIGSDVIKADQIADSYKKVMTADFIASISRKDEDKLNNTARFHVIKNRFGADGLTFAAQMDTSLGTIKLNDIPLGGGNNSITNTGNSTNQRVKDILGITDND